MYFEQDLELGFSLELMISFGGMYFKINEIWIHIVINIFGTNSGAIFLVSNAPIECNPFYTQPIEYGY